MGHIKDFITEDVFHKNNGISGIPKDHSFQEVFKLFKVKEKYGITLLNLETADTSMQGTAQISLVWVDYDPTQQVDWPAMECRERRLWIVFNSVIKQLDAQQLYFTITLCINLVNYWDKYTEMHDQQKSKFVNFIFGYELKVKFRKILARFWDNDVPS